MKVNRLTDVIWEIPETEKSGMLVPARIYGTEKILRAMDAGVFEQVTNVACLPGIQRYALCMPDGHWGYGFPIGGVAAFDVGKGIISPGGVGYDINCGMRLIRTDLTLADVKPTVGCPDDGVVSHGPCRGRVERLCKSVPSDLSGSDEERSTMERRNKGMDGTVISPIRKKKAV